MPSIADPTDSHLVKPKTLLDCCRSARHRTGVITQFAYLQAAAVRKDKQCYLWTLVNIRRLVCCMTSEAGLETVLSAAFSLKHETDMMKTFSSHEEAFDKANEMGLTPEKAAKSIRETPSGRVAFYDEARGEPVKPDDWKPPDFRSLIKIAQTEQGRSEASCVPEHVQGLTMAKPMIFTDDTRPSHFTFANQIGVQTDEDEKEATQVPDELRCAVESHLWLASLEVSSGITPTMSTNATMPRQPHPDGPTEMTRSQLACEQIALDEAQTARDVSRML